MTEGLDILVKWPTRARPELFRRQFARWQNPRVRFVVTIDEDDPSSNNPEFLGFLAGQGNVRAAVGKHSGKIDACNADLAGETFDILILASDDMRPRNLHGPADYDLRIAQLFREKIPDLDGVLQLSDGRLHPDIGLITLSIMGGLYYRRFGYIYHPDYKSVWADNEFGDVARQLGKCVRVDECLIEHDWIGGSEPDELHRHNESFYRVDEGVYYRRKYSGFGIKTPAVVDPHAVANL